MSAAPTVRWYASLHTHLMLWVGALVAALLLAGFAVAFHALQDRTVADAQARIRYEARQTADNLQASMDSVRISGEGMTGLFRRKQDQPAAALIEEFRVVLAANPSVAGGLLAVEPGVLADRQRLSYYVGISGRGGPDRDLLAVGYEVERQPWYQRTLKASAPWWSEPYFNETAGGRFMATLNMPLRDANGLSIGMVSLDVPVAGFSAALDPLRSVTGQRPSLFAPAGTIAVHPEQGIAFANDFAGYIRNFGRPELEPFERARARHDSLDLTYMAKGGNEKRYGVLEPIGDSGWSLLLAYSHMAMLADLDSAMRLLGLVALAVTLLAALAILRVARRITVPLSELAVSAGHFAAGEFEWPVPHDARADEVGVMARALERARDSIRQQMVEIGRYAAEKQKLASELQIAHDIQQSMVPPPRRFVHDGGMVLDVHGALEPAREVGGDFYAYHAADGVFWFGIGDVSDKGIPAALFMARSDAILKAASNGVDTPAQALAVASPLLAEGNDACMFTTTLIGRIDLRTGDCMLSSAGHDTPLLLRADGSVEQLVFEGGPALGFDVCRDFPLWRGRLAPGDTLVAWTDGVTEAFNAQDEAFGETRLRQALRGTPLSAAAACEVLMKAVREFAGAAPQSDDITLLALHRMPGRVQAPAMAGFRLHLRVPGDRGRLPEAMAAIETTLRAAGGGDGLVHEVELVVEELVCNTMDHGGPFDGQGELVFALAFDEGRVVLDYRDNGIEYDPLSQAPPELDADIGDRPIGGLGIHLVRTLAREIRYARVDGWNTLHIVLNAIL